MPGVRQRASPDPRRDGRTRRSHLGGEMFAAAPKMAGLALEVSRVTVLLVGGRGRLAAVRWGEGIAVPFPPQSHMAPRFSSASAN